MEMNLVKVKRPRSSGNSSVVPNSQEQSRGVVSRRYTRAYTILEGSG